MKFTPTRIEGAFVVDLKPREDCRGFFARSFCIDEFEAHGLSLSIRQSNIAVTRRQGTVRGLHYQSPPVTEAKLVRCTRGAIYDVIVDMRLSSPTYQEHFSVKLTEANGRALYIPPLCAHGYQTLVDHSEMSYLVSEPYSPIYERGLRYNDPALAIRWPLTVTCVSEKDVSWPLVNESAVLNRI